MTHTIINQEIANRKLFTGNDDDTYYNEILYGFSCDNFNDTYLLFKLAVYGYYAKKYKWTKEQADWFIETQKENSVQWSDGNQVYYYDWGRGKNAITKDYLHVPNLDHILPKSLGGTDDPENMRIRCRRVNENKGNTNSNKERRATIIDMFNDIDDVQEKKSLLEYLSKQLT